MNPKTQKWKMDHQTNSTSENIQPPQKKKNPNIQMGSESNKEQFKLRVP